MSKQWFLVESYGATIDLSQVTEVCWNFKPGPKSRYATLICLGTDIVYLRDDKSTGSNQRLIFNGKDRIRLQTMLVDMDLPTVKLLGIDEINEEDETV